MTPTPRAWYREPWPWLLMAGPAAVVLAGVVTTALAVTSFDGLVADDYYKQGLAINRVIARESTAKRLGLSGIAAFTEERDRVRVTVREDAPAAALRLTLSHPTLPAQDQAVSLAAVAPGVYEGALRPPAGVRMHARLEDVEGRWRLSAVWDPREPTVRFAP